MDFRSTERRIVVSLVICLIAIQVATFFVLRESNARSAVDTMGGVLRTGVHVSLSLLETRQKQLDESAALLAGDFGLRQAIASGDKPTADSMIENHAKRARGLLVAVYDLDGGLIVKSPELQVGNRLAAAAREGRAGGGQHAIQVTPIDAAGGQVFQLAVAEVRAPVPIARIVVGFAVDNGFADALAELTGMQFVFLSRLGSGPWRVHGGNLPDELTRSLMTRNGFEGELHDPYTQWVLPSNDETYLMSPMRVHKAEAVEVVAILGKSLEYAMQPLRKVERTVLYLLLGSLLLSAAAIWWVTRSLVAPINKSANLDALTGLFNRRYFESNFVQTLQNAGHRQSRMAVLMMDLNKFKAINDTLGHAAGDRVLVVVAARLREVFRTTDVIARLGGDEFAVLMPGLGAQLGRVVLENAVRKIAEPFELAGRTVSVGASIGVALIPEDGVDPATLTDKADRAMYYAKTNGTGHAFFADLPSAAAASEETAEAPEAAA